MEMALRVISVLGGLFLVLLAVSSAIRTVILPRAAPSFVTRVVSVSYTHPPSPRD